MYEPRAAAREKSCRLGKVTSHRPYGTAVRFHRPPSPELLHRGWRNLDAELSTAQRLTISGFPYRHLNLLPAGLQRGGRVSDRALANGEMLSACRHRFLKCLYLAVHQHAYALITRHTCDCPSVQPCAPARYTRDVLPWQMIELTMHPWRISSTQK